MPTLTVGWMRMAGIRDTGYGAGTGSYSTTAIQTALEGATSNSATTLAIVPGGGRQVNPNRVTMWCFL